MTSYRRWQDVRATHVERAGGEAAVQAGKEELLAPVRGRRLAEIRRSRGLTQQEVADRMGVTRGWEFTARQMLGFATRHSASRGVARLMQSRISLFSRVGK
jgi:hypothetical protein